MTLEAQPAQAPIRLLAAKTRRLPNLALRQLERMRLLIQKSMVIL
jgi:hypothetical protein